MDTHTTPHNLQTTAHRCHHHHHHHNHHHFQLSSSQDHNRNTTPNNNLADKHAYNFSPVAGGVDSGRTTTTTPPPPPPPLAVEETGRERLKRHRVEMAGRVWIPDIWGQEDLLKDWVDCSVFDSSMENKSIMSARTALVQEARSTVRIENRC